LVPYLSFPSGESSLASGSLIALPFPEILLDRPQLAQSRMLLVLHSLEEKEQLYPLQEYERRFLIYPVRTGREDRL